LMVRSGKNSPIIIRGEWLKLVQYSKLFEYVSTTLHLAKGCDIRQLKNFILRFFHTAALSFVLTIEKNL
jgi:hypothetical protein